jgi:murein DD-endopeptidase
MKGTDFAVRDMQAMRRGVDVRAIAAGIVRRLRNNVNGHELKIPADQVQGKECGNGVVIRHADGWES